MNSWVNYEGYPIITVTRNYSNNSAELKQERFFNRVEDATTETHIWQVPINYATASHPDFNDTKPEIWFETSLTNINLNADSKDWIILNKQVTGRLFEN